MSTPSFLKELNLTLYSEAFEMLRFYGDKAILVRNIAYTQGFVILSSVGFLLENREINIFNLLAPALSIFCLLFTIALWWAHNNYHNYYLDIRTLIGNIEAKLQINKSDVSYIETVETKRDERVDSNLGKLKIHGSFWVIGIAASMMFLTSLYVVFYKLEYFKCIVIL